MTVEEAYAEPVAKKRRKDHSFLIGVIIGIIAGIIATVMLNRAAEDDLGLDEEPVVELQPAMAPLGGDPLARNVASAGPGAQA
jgi:hypothetical protein